MGRTNIGNTTIVTYPIYGSDINASPTTTIPPIPAGACSFAFKQYEDFNTAIGSMPATIELLQWHADGAGQINGFHASVKVPGSSSSISIDLKKNGSSILTAPITLTNTSTPATIYNATIASPLFSAGDYFSFTLVVSSSTGMSGIAAWMNGVETFLPQ